VTITVDAPPPEEPTPEPTVEPTATPTRTPSPPPPFTPEAPPPAPAGVGPPPTQPPPPPAAAPAPKRAAARCRIPKLRGKTVLAAGRTLRRAGCRVGKVTRKKARSGKRRRVIAQSPRAGLRRPAGARVKLTVRR
jgi:hypothetical protein